MAHEDLLPCASLLRIFTLNLRVAFLLGEPETLLRGYWHRSSSLAIHPPSIWDPNALFCFSSGKPGLIEVSVPGKSASSPPASTHPQEEQQQQARPVHGAAGGT